MPSRVRIAALVVAGSLALHQLRYLIAAAPGTAAEQGHSYLPLAGSVAVVLLGLACAQLALLVQRARSRRIEAEAEPLPLGVAWIAATVALFAVYSGAELVEGAVAGGHASGLAAITAHGGWIALPLAVMLGALVALALAGASAVVASAARRLGSALLRATPVPRRALPRAHRPLTGVLARNLAGRAPPLAS